MDDTVITVGGKKIGAEDDLVVSEIAARRPGDVIEFEIERGGVLRKIPVTLGLMPPDLGLGRHMAAAEAGNSYSMVVVGGGYFDGRPGLKKDVDEGLRWFRRATETGDPRAWLYLGMHYRDGDDLAKDEAEAIRCFEQALLAAEKRPFKGLIADACIELFKLEYDRESNSRRLLDLLQRAADDGSLDALWRLGAMHTSEQKIPKDYEKAVEYFHAAAKEDYAMAEASLGVLIFEGLGVEKNVERALGWLESGARHGDSEAMFYLGERYETGDSVPKSLTRATEWYRKAADLGHERAKKKLE
jgi:uncharacterized protein